MPTSTNFDDPASVVVIHVVNARESLCVTHRMTNPQMSLTCDFPGLARAASHRRLTKLCDLMSATNQEERPLACHLFRRPTEN